MEKTTRENLHRITYMKGEEIEKIEKKANRINEAAGI